MRPERNPYVGPRPFELADVDVFFGRTREVRDLASLVVAHRVVLLYSTSGAGKSSLINAGLAPALAERGFQVLPPARVSTSPDTSDVGNIFAASVIAAWAGPEQAPRTSLAEFLRSLPRDVDDEAQPVRRLAVIDQFEELFTAYPESWSERPGLFDELQAALEDDDRLRIVLALREEFLAQLEPFAPLVPDSLRTRFRLERLDHDGALAAVTGPAIRTGRQFTPEAAEELVTNLRMLKPGVVGEYVEPVHLQVVCSELWTRLRPGVNEITTRQLREFADLDTVLARFYEDALASAMRSARRLSESRIRTWVKEELITSGGTRGTVYRGDEQTEGLPNAAVDALEQKRLIRAEERARARWYELTHDRLIEPIRASNARYFSTRQARRRRLVGLGVALILPIIGVVALAQSFRGGSPPSRFVSATLAPSSLDFGSRSDPAQFQALEVAMSSGSKEQHIVEQRIVNSSGSGDSSDFTIAEPCPAKLAAGRSCTISVRFNPTGAGRRTQQLDVRTDNGDLHAQLIGTVAGRCGVERWPVKTLSDADAKGVHLDPRPTTIDALVTLPAPRPLKPQRVASVEYTTYTVVARLVAMSLEEDSDIKVVIASPKSGATMVAELPAVSCILGAEPALQARMRSARSALTAACGQPGAGGRFTVLHGTASITGVGFFGFVHGGRGQARNGIELHPVLDFARAGCGAAVLAPDLVISSFSATIVSPIVRFVVTVTNVGASSAATSLLTVSAPGWNPIRMALPGRLPPNSSVRVTGSVAIPRAAKGRTAALTATVDPENAIKEANESNNVTVTRVIVPPR